MSRKKTTDTETHSRPTQCERILKYMADFGSITQAEAYGDLGVMRLASRISELRKRGYPITDAPETVKKPVRGALLHQAVQHGAKRGMTPWKNGV